MQIESDKGGGFDAESSMSNLGVAIMRQCERGAQQIIARTYVSTDAATVAYPRRRYMESLVNQHRNGTVRVDWHGGDRFDIRIRHHTVRVDQLTDFGGTDTGPTPMELFIGSLAVCVAHCAERYLHRWELAAGVTVTANYDLGLRPAHIDRVELLVDAPGVPEGLRESFTTLVEHTPVQNSLRLPPEITFRVRTMDDDPALDRS